jgi:hypothetical protein
VLDRLAIRIGTRLVTIGSWLVSGQYWPIIDRITGRRWEEDADA